MLAYEVSLCLTCSSYIGVLTPVDLWNIQASCRDVCADQGAGLSVDELEKAVRSRLLLELAVERQYGEIDIVKQFTIKIDGSARG
jgi:hypothetical protein